MRINTNNSEWFFLCTLRNEKNSQKYIVERQRALSALRSNPGLSPRDWHSSCQTSISFFQFKRDIINNLVLENKVHSINDLFFAQPQSCVL